MNRPNRVGVEDVVLSPQAADMLGYLLGDVSEPYYILADLREQSYQWDEPLTWNQVINLAERIAFHAIDVARTMEFMRREEQAYIHRSAAELWQTARRNPWAIALPADLLPVIWFTREPTDDEIAQLQIILARRY